MFLYIFLEQDNEVEMYETSPSFHLLSAYYFIKLSFIYKFSILIKTPNSGHFSMHYYTNLSHWLQLKSLYRDTKAGYFWNVNNGRQNRDRSQKIVEQAVWGRVYCYFPLL